MLAVKDESVGTKGGECRMVDILALERSSIVSDGIYLHCIASYAFNEIIQASFFKRFDREIMEGLQILEEICVVECQQQIICWPQGI